MYLTKNVLRREMTPLIKKNQNFKISSPRKHQAYIILYVSPTKLSSRQMYQSYTNSTRDEKNSNAPQCSQYYQ